MIKLYDLAVATRKYMKDGQEKASWLNVGSVIQGDNSPFIMLKAHFNPAGITRKEGAESISISLFTPKDSTYSYDNFCWSSSVGLKLYDMCVGTRKYVKDGQEKTVWENVGAIIMGEKNPYMVLKAHFNPAAIQRKEGSESITISLFRPKDKDSQQGGYYGGGDSYGGADNFEPMDYDSNTGFSSQSDMNPNNIPF